MGVDLKDVELLALIRGSTTSNLLICNDPIVTENQKCVKLSLKPIRLSGSRKNSVLPVFEHLFSFHYLFAVLSV